MLDEAVIMSKLPNKGHTRYNSIFRKKRNEVKTTRTIEKLKDLKQN